MNGLAFDKLEIPFSKGLNQKTDARLVQAPELVRAVDIEFDDTGGLRLRKPYASIGANIFGGGTISDCRRIYAFGSELILFTKTALYSWSSQKSAWVLKGTHLAIKVEEEPTFINTSNQDDCDRAQLSGTVVYCWRQTVTGVNEIFVAAQDATTGAVLLTPTDVASGARPQLVVLDTVIVLIYENGTGSLVARTINPSTLAISGATTLLAAASFNSYYDAEKIPGSDSFVLACRRDVTTSYEIMKVTSALAVTTVTKARVCDGPIAVGCAPNGSVVQVVRGNGTNIQGDLITISTLADGAAIASALGTGTSTINQITVCSHDAAGPAGTFVAFWHSNESTALTNMVVAQNTVTTGGVVGTQTAVTRLLGVASRAFAYGGSVYVWVAFGGQSAFAGAAPSEFRAQLQNSYFLYRSDGLLCAKAAWMHGGGLRSTGLLPHVELTSGTTTFSFCGGERRVIPLGEIISDTDSVRDGVTLQSTYADTGPRDITFTFDSNDARRCARLGQTLYIAGGEVMQYDGREVVELGFNTFPWYWGTLEAAGTGNIPAGAYFIRNSYRYDNAKGERERSPSSISGQVTIASPPNNQFETTLWPPLHATNKNGVAVESWRTAIAGSAFYKTTSSDPTVGTGLNRYVENDRTNYTLGTFEDELLDAALIKLEPNPENGDELESLAPPPASIITASADRLFLAGIPGEPNKIVYSKLRSDGFLAAFHDALAVLLPTSTGAITALGLLNESLVAFCESAVYVLDGSGYDNIGGGANYTARLVSTDVGCVSHEAMALIPAGLMFKSRKGWCVLNRGLAVDTRLGAGYIGAGIADYDSEEVYAAHVVEAQHQVRIVTSGRVLVYDYVSDGWWAEWSIADGLHAAIWNGTYHTLATASVRAEQATHALADYGMDVEILIQLGGLQGFARVTKALILGEYRSAHTLRCRVGRYTEAVYFQDKTITPTGYSVGEELEEMLGLAQQQHKAIRFRITSAPTTTGEQLRLSALTLKVGMKPGIYPRIPPAQRS